MRRILAIVERELRRFRRRLPVVAMTIAFPLIQLVVLGYSFGGDIKHARVGLIDHDRGPAALAFRVMAGKLASGTPTVRITDYLDEREALQDLRNGRLDGLLTIPPGFSNQRTDAAAPQLGLTADNSDGFVAAALSSWVRRILVAYNETRAPEMIPRLTTVAVTELYQPVPYIQYVLAGSITLSIFMMVTVGGGIIYIDDKARGLHEGYLVTPIRKFELIAGFSLAGTLMAVGAGMLMTMLGSLLTGIPHPFDPVRLLNVSIVSVCVGLALVSLTFLLVVRVNDPFVPRAIFAVLNTVLFFPSGAVYPQQAFPSWMQGIAAVNPFTYAVHAFRALLLRDAGLEAIQSDLLYLTLSAAAAMTAVTMLFKRTL